MNQAQRDPGGSADGSGAGTVERNLAYYLERHPAEAPALITADGVVTHGDLRSAISRWRSALVEAGVGPGDRVAVLTGNNPDFVFVHIAAMGLGAISVPLNCDSPSAELLPQLESVDPAVVHVGPEGERVWAGIAAPFADRRLAPPAANEGDGNGSFGPDPGVVAVSGSDPALLIFTSGTAGPSKAAILTHDNLVSSLQSVLSLPLDLVSVPESFLAVIPLFHVFGVHMVVHLALITGGSVILDEYGNAQHMLELIRTHRPTVVAGPPALWQRMAAQGGQATDFGSVKLAVSGAAALLPKLAVQVDDQLGLVLHDGYGLTESSAVAASTLGVDDPPLGSVGLLMPGVEARIVDTDGSECLTGDPGELWLRGPMISPGYWGEPGRHASRVEDGWLLTGDVAVVDENGYLAIVGRRKDLIIVSGFNVYPAEVEAALLTHPGVAQVGVVGEPLDATGEAVVAFVVPEPGVTLDDSELWSHCGERLARYKVPHRFVIAEQLPLGPTGKLRRNQLLAQP
ncbi:MAG: AMP-binding protein [Acidimicrobiia bacterium]|nr:AMP-binding protein [Acidimicrobiia bacterium]